jgi:AraC family transcriptional regulator
VRHRSGRALTIAVPPGSGGTTSADPLDWEGVPEPAECVEIRPDDALRRASAEALGDASWAEFPQVTGIRDAALFATASRIRAAARGGEPMEELEADALAELLVRHMIRRVFRLPRERATEARLDPLRLDKVDALIGDRLSEPLRLDALASEAGLSRWHFLRVFRRTTGLSPAAYLAARRAEAARALLTDTPMPVAAVARAVGYANVHHFRRVFVRHHGASPTEVRSSFASRRVRMPSSMD